MANRRNILLCSPFWDRRVQEAKFGWSTMPFMFAQKKLNGNRMRMVENEYEVELHTSEANKIKHINHIRRELEVFKEHGLLADGEAYTHGFDSYDVKSILSRQHAPHEDEQALNYYVFDLVDEEKPQHERFKILDKFFEMYSDFRYVKYVKPEPISPTVAAAHQFLENECIPQGYEGAVFRHPMNMYKVQDPAYRSTQVMKFKPHQTDTYTGVTIEGAVSADGTPKQMVGVIICSDDEGNQFPISAGKLSHAQRRRIFNEPELIQGESIYVKYQAKRDGVPLSAIVDEILTGPLAGCVQHGTV